LAPSRRDSLAFWLPGTRFELLRGGCQSDSLNIYSKTYNIVFTEIIDILKNKTSKVCLIKDKYHKYISIYAL
jgi:hypothetical protein